MTNASHLGQDSYLSMISGFSTLLGEVLPLLHNANARLHSISEIAPQTLNWHGGDKWVVSICSVGNYYVTKTGKTPLEALQKTWNAYTTTPIDDLIATPEKKKALALDDLGL